MEILTIIVSVVYIALLYELMMGWNRRPNKKFYLKLFDPKIYLVILCISVLLLIKPVMDLVSTGQFTLPLLATPFVYLLLFRLINRISILVNKRNIIIAGRGDNWPAGHKWYVDSLLHFAAVIIAILLPLLLSLYLEGRI